MSVLGHLGNLPKKLITAIVRSGEGQVLLEKLVVLPGVLSVSHHHARGGGAWDASGQQHDFFKEKDVLIVLVEEERADDVFAAIYYEGRINQPNHGMLFMEKVLRGHPLLPFGSSDW